MIYNLDSSAQKGKYKYEKNCNNIKSIAYEWCYQSISRNAAKIDYEVVEIDLWVLDFSNMAEAWVAQIPEKVRIREIPRYEIATGIFVKS